MKRLLVLGLSAFLLSACGNQEFHPPRPEAGVAEVLADSVIALRASVQATDCKIVIADATFGTDRETLAKEGAAFIHQAPKDLRAAYVIRKLPVGMTNVQGDSVSWGIVVVALQCP